MDGCASNMDAPLTHAPTRHAPTRHAPTRHAPTRAHACAPARAHAGTRAHMLGEEQEEVACPSRVCSCATALKCSHATPPIISQNANPSPLLSQPLSSPYPFPTPHICPHAPLYLVQAQPFINMSDDLFSSSLGFCTVIIFLCAYAFKNAALTGLASIQVWVLGGLRIAADSRRCALVCLCAHLVFSSRRVRFWFAPIRALSCVRERVCVHSPRHPPQHCAPHAPVDTHRTRCPSSSGPCT
eukprot:5222309-Prymnesium_polylepis.1